MQNKILIVFSFLIAGFAAIRLATPVSALFIEKNDTKTAPQTVKTCGCNKSNDGTCGCGGSQTAACTGSKNGTCGCQK